MEEYQKIWYLSLLLTNLELKEDKVLKSFLNFLKSCIENKKREEILVSYADFIEKLNSSCIKDFSKYLKNLLCKNKHSYYEEEQFNKEAKIISLISKIDFENIKKIISEIFGDIEEIVELLPEFKNSKIEINENYKEIEFITDDLFSKNKAFIFDNDLEIKPVDFNEKISFANLKGYVSQKRVIYENTKALLEGRRVNNILLYGDAGCGKSSTIRALLNEFDSLKMIQIFKNNLINLDKLFDKLKYAPDKFIIFADDISFEDNDPAFSTMKAILEGSLIQCPKNAVIYATSNRRHLVKESFKSRAGDEIHLKDTMNELNSLSERFGINLLFKKPTMEEFIQIVLELAHDENIQIADEYLIEKAKKDSLLKGSTSPRVAKQLIDNVLAFVNV